MSDSVEIAGYARTPMGGFQDVFGGVKSTDLGARAVRAAVERAGVSPEAVERIYMGCVLPAGLPISVEATTVNKICGSGKQKTPTQPASRWAPFAQHTADEYQFTRDSQDEYALRSLDRAKAAIASSAFAREITPVTVSRRGGDVAVHTDEQPGNAKPDKISGLKPAFAKDGTITAASSASISDGAAALVMTRASVAEKLGLNVSARVVAHAAHAQERPNSSTRRSLPFKSCWRKPAGISPMSICSKSTRPSPSSP